MNVLRALVVAAYLILNLLIWLLIAAGVPMQVPW